MNKVREIRSLQKGQSQGKDEKKSGETLGFRPEGILREGNGTPRWIDEREVSEIIGVAVQTLRNWRFQSTGPAYFKIGKSVRYRLVDIIAFMELRRVEPSK